MPASATNSTFLDARTLADIDARVGRFRETRDPSHLWPGLDERSRVAAASEIERVARADLAGGHSLDLDAQGRHSDYAIAIAAHTTGMGPLLGYWLESGHLATTPGHGGKLRDHLDHARRREIRMKHGLRPALDALIEAGITPVALKGLHTSRTYYDEPALRRMSDVDLYVSPARRSDAERAMAAAGFRRHGESPVAHKSDWIAPGVSERDHSLELADEFSRWTVELHTSLDSVFYRGAVARLDALANETTAITIDDRLLQALRPESLVIMLACHCSELDASRLLRVYELALVAKRGVDWDRVFALLQHTGAARFTWPALHLVESLAPRSVDPRVLDLGRRESTWAARHTVNRLTPAGGRIGDIGLLRQLMWAKGPAAILERAARVLWPTRRTEAERGRAGWRSRLGQWRRGRLTIGAPDERQPR